MCFAPQRRALFRHVNFQKRSEHGVLCTFWLGNVLGATTTCSFLSLIWPDGSAPAALASLLFDPPEPQIIGKTQCFAIFLPFRAPGSSFFWDFLFFDFLFLLFSCLLWLFPSLLFHLSILSEVWFLNFLRWFSMYTKKEKHLPLHGWVDTIYRQSVPVVTLWLKVLASSQIQKMETMEATVCYLSSMSHLSTATVSTSTGEDSVGGSWGGVGAAEADWGRLLILGRVSSWMIRSFGEIWNTPYKMALSWKKVVKP